MKKINQKIYALVENGFKVHPHVKAVALFISILIFVGGFFLSIKHNPGLLHNLSWYYLVLIVFVGVPITVVVNAARYYLTGLVLKQKVALPDALNITVLSTAANMLPLPVGVFVRIAGLKSEATSYKQSALATLVVFFMWIGVTSLYSAIALYFLASKLALVMVVLAISGLVVILISIYMLSALGSGYWVIMAILVNELFAAIADAFRLWLCFMAVGHAAEFIETSVLTISAVAGSAVGIIPAGLGFREAVTALISPMVDIPASAGFVASALNRLLGFAGIVPIVMFLFLQTWFKNNK